MFVLTTKCAIVALDGLMENLSKEKKIYLFLTEITIFLTFNSILPVPKINGISATTILTTSFIIPKSWYYNDAFSVTHSAKATYYHYFPHLYGT